MVVLKIDARLLDENNYILIAALFRMLRNLEFGTGQLQIDSVIVAMERGFPMTSTI